MTNEENLRALLAEARREHDGDANIGACGTDNDGNDTRCDRCQRIDAALAERAPSIDWQPDRFYGNGSVEARVNGCYVEVHDIDYDDEFPWQWSVSRSEIAESGNAKTREAAIESVFRFVKERTR